MTATSTQPVRPQNTAAQMPEVPLTTEGYSVLHQMMRFRWTAWRALPEAKRNEIAEEFGAALGEMEKNKDGQSALFSLIGHKGDLMLVHFRKSFADLNQAELKVAGLRSRHNTYMSVPLLWAMIGQHTTYFAGGNLGIPSNLYWVFWLIIIIIGWHIVFQCYKKAGKVPGF